MKNNFVYRIVQAALALLVLTTTHHALAAGYMAQSGKIYDGNGQEIQVRGVSHYGFNATILQPQYLWAMGWKEQIAQMKSLGFNAIRVPFVPDTLYNTTPVDQLNYINAGLNPELIGKTPLQALDLWMAEANRQGMYILLDFHSVSKLRQYPTWFVSNPAEYNLIYNNQAYTKENWTRDLAFVAKRYANLAYFFGIDIYNEPNGVVRWSTGDTNATNPANFWKDAAESAATAVLAANPNLLIFVQGTMGNYDGLENSNIPMNWGENFQPQAYQPLNIPHDKLVLTPHTYGPDVSMKSSFSAANFPANLPAHWDALFGQFSQTHPVIIGEWGGKYGNGTGGQQDITWQNAFVDYLLSKGIRNSFYWCYTPNSGDTGGILDDNLNVRQDKMALLQKLWGTTTTPTPTPTPTAVGSQSLFDDAVVAAWALTSWSATALAQNQFVKTGSNAMKVDAATWGGISIDSRDANWSWTDQPASRYTHLSFDVSGGANVGAAMNTLETGLDLGWGLSAKISNYVTSFAPGAWYHVEIPLSILNPNSVSFRRIVFQNNSTSNLAFYLDNVALVNRTTSTTTATTTTTTPVASTTPLQSCAGIMPLGDSITLGVNGGYRNNLYTGLQQNNCGVSYVGTQADQYTRIADTDHEGHSGFTIGNIASSVNGWLATTQPNIITLMIGTNDTAWWTGETAAQIGARHNALIDQIRAARPNAWLFVASIPPQSSAIIQPNNVDRAVLTQQLNTVIQGNVSARSKAGERVRFVDVNSVLTTADLYDGIHPSEAAHARIAQKFLDEIRVALGSASTATVATAPVVTSPSTSYPQPGIQSFSPASGAVGTVVTVNGSGFTGANLAWIGNARNVAVTVISDSQVRLTIPADATTGAIGVFNPANVAFSPSSFNVTSGTTATYPQPGIQSFSPSSGGVGTVVTLNGSGFTGANLAWVGAAHNGTVRVISDTQAQVTIPAGATTGAIGIFNPARVAFTASSFTVY
ncbi:MAG: cellulase family glycosylhydrolase [Gammaproteobacteria bacterium]|nr:cellulase family glycosylhydrolase [Gammaproteobacteria bacterium]